MPAPSTPFSTGRTILLVIAATYVLSAALLLGARLHGEPVSRRAALLWLLTGAAGVALALRLAPGGRFEWVALLVVLVPWMLVSLAGDWDRGLVVMTLVDAAALVGTAAGHAMTFAAVWRR